MTQNSKKSRIRINTHFVNTRFAAELAFVHSTAIRGLWFN